jgi:hypothetical protein
MICVGIKTPLDVFECCAYAFRKANLTNYELTLVCKPVRHVRQLSACIGGKLTVAMRSCAPEIPFPSRILIVPKKNPTATEEGVRKGIYISTPRQLTWGQDCLVEPNLSKGN